MEKKSVSPVLELPSLHRRAFVRTALIGAGALAIGCEAASRGGDPIRFEALDDAGAPELRQFPPTASYLIRAYDGSVYTDVFRIVSLAGTTLQTSPAFAWTAVKEHIFAVAAVTNLETVLAAATQIQVQLVHRSATSTPDATISSFAQSTITSSARFQAYAKPVLGTSDWVSGAPSYGTKAHYFVASGTDAGRMRLLFDVNPSSLGELTKLVWISQINTVPGYFLGSPDGTTITLSAAALNTIPTSNVYRYESPHV